MSLSITKTTNAIEAFLAFPFLRSIDTYYPNIADWFVNAVVPGLAQGDSVLLLAKEDQRVVGMALGKTGAEKKLRCLRTDGTYSGLGIRLLDRMIDELEEDKPFCTVSQELLDQYSRPFINRYGFDLSHVSKGQYRPGKLEYHFNGVDK